MHESKREATFPSKSHRQPAAVPDDQVHSAQDPLTRVQQAGIPSISRQAAVLNRSTASRQGQLLLQLQRQYGNQYVQRVLDLSRQGEGQAEATPEIEAAIARNRGGGQPLDAGVRVQMESAFGTDFSNVRVHTSTESDHLNQALSARAFTTGQDIFFRQGEYSPASSGGKELLAHELTHVVQQTGAIQGKLTIGEPNDQYEQEADQVASAVMRTLDTGSSGAEPIHSTGTPLTQRMCADCAEVQPKRMLEEEELLQPKAMSELPNLTSPISQIQRAIANPQTLLVKNHLTTATIQGGWTRDRLRHDSDYGALFGRSGNHDENIAYLSSGNGVWGEVEAWQTKRRFEWCIDGGTTSLFGWKSSQYTFKHDGRDNNYLEFTVSGELLGSAKAQDWHYAKSGAAVVGFMRVRTPTATTPTPRELFRIKDGGKSSASSSTVADVELTIPFDGANATIKIPLKATREGELSPYSESLTPPLSENVAGTPGVETFVDVYLAARIEAAADIESTCVPENPNDTNWADAIARYHMIRWTDNRAPGVVSPGTTSEGGAGTMGASSAGGGSTVVPTNVHAFGGRSKPRDPRANTDIPLNPDGTVGPEPKTPPWPNGASTFGDVSYAPLTGHYHRLASGTVLPSGLRIIPDGREVGGPHGRTHHTIFPSVKMPFQDFVDKFQRSGWSYAGKK